MPSIAPNPQTSKPLTTTPATTRSAAPPPPAPATRPTSADQTRSASSAPHEETTAADRASTGSSTYAPTKRSPGRICGAAAPAETPPRNPRTSPGRPAWGRERSAGARSEPYPLPIEAGRGGRRPKNIGRRPRTKANPSLVSRSRSNIAIDRDQSWSMIQRGRRLPPATPGQPIDSVTAARGSASPARAPNQTPSKREGKLTEISDFAPGYILQDNNILLAGRPHLRQVFADYIMPQIWRRPRELPESQYILSADLDSIQQALRQDKSTSKCKWVPLSRRSVQMPSATNGDQCSDASPVHRKLRRSSDHLGSGTTLYFQYSWSSLLCDDCARRMR